MCSVKFKLSSLLLSTNNRNDQELTISKVGSPQGFTPIPNLPALTWACLESSLKLNTWLEGSIESVNHLWSVNHNIIYGPHSYKYYITAYITN